MMKFLLLVFAILSSLPLSALAQSADSPVLGNSRLMVSEIKEPPPTGGIISRLGDFLGARGPTISRPAPGTQFTVISSAYAPSPYQTDNTPCYTAAGTKVRRGTVASNFLPLGTILDIEGDTYIVEDRMNARYGKAIDIFYLHTDKALAFGRQQVTVTVVGYGEPGQSLAAYIPPEAEDTPDQEQSPGFISRLTGRLTYLQSSFSEYIGIRKPVDVNRYDVDCLNEGE